MALAVATGGGCSGTPATRDRAGGCSKDTDCRDPRICERGACVDPHHATAPTGSPPTTDGSAAVGSRTPVAGAPPFAMFGGDARHTGRRGGPAPQRAPKEVWKVAVGNVIAGSPTIGPDGTIYVTSHDG